MGNTPAEWKNLQSDIRVFQAELERMSESVEFHNIWRFFSRGKGADKRRNQEPHSPPAPHEDEKPPKPVAPAEEPAPHVEEGDNEAKARLRYYEDVHAFRSIFEVLAKVMTKYMEQAEQTEQAEQAQREEEQNSGNDEDQQGLPDDSEQSGGDDQQTYADNNKESTQEEGGTKLPMVYYLLRD